MKFDITPIPISRWRIAFTFLDTRWVTVYREIGYSERSRVQLFPCSSCCELGINFIESIEQFGCMKCKKPVDPRFNTPDVFAYNIALRVTEDRWGHDLNDGHEKLMNALGINPYNHLLEMNKLCTEWGLLTDSLVLNPPMKRFVYDSDE